MTKYTERRALRLLLISYGPTVLASNGYFNSVQSLKKVLRQEFSLKSMEFVSEDENCREADTSYVGISSKFLLQWLQICLCSVLSVGVIHDCELVMIEGSIFSPFALVSRLFKKKVIFDTHGMIVSMASRYRESALQNFRRKFLGFLLDKTASLVSNVTVVTSSYDKDFAANILKVDRRKLAIRAESIDPQKIVLLSKTDRDKLRIQLGFSDSKINAIFVGDMRSIQNQTAVQFICDNIDLIPSNVNIIVVGRAKHLPSNHGNNLVFTGFVKDVNQYFETADVLIAPLITGTGLKTKIIEAFAHGLPVITTEIGAEGIVTEDSDDIMTVAPSDFFEALKQFSRTHHKRERSVDLIRIYRENYSLEALKKSLEDIIYRIGFQGGSSECYE